METLAEVAEKPKKITPPEAVKEQRISSGRPQKYCQFCGAPNDKFVPICWMCKRSV